MKTESAGPKYVYCLFDPVGNIIDWSRGRKLDHEQPSCVQIKYIREDEALAAKLSGAGEQISWPTNDAKSDPNQLWTREHCKNYPTEAAALLNEFIVAAREKATPPQPLSDQLYLAENILRRYPEGWAEYKTKGIGTTAGEKGNE